jgi:hypothetical protein
VLFDLQSPRRRRVIRVTFGALAAIFALSFVFLGVGTGGAGFSISDLFGGGGGSSDVSSAFDDDIKAAQEKLAANPNDTTALAQLVQLHYQAGSQDVNSDGTLNSDGEQQLREGADAWNKYLKQSKGKVDATAALFALNTFDQLGSVDFQKGRTATTTSDALTSVSAAVDDWKSAAQAQQFLIDDQPKKATPNTYARLASYLYLSGQTQAGGQAAAQANGGKSSSQATSQLKQIQQLGQQLQAAIKQLTKQQQKTQSAGATGGATGGGNPLSGIGGSLGGSGGGF